MSSHIWNSHVIDVRSLAVWRQLWLTVRLEVLVDGHLAGVSSHRVRLRERVPFEIGPNDNAAHGYVETGRFNSVLRTKYRVVLNDQAIGTGVVAARNWYMTYLFIGLSLLLIFELAKTYTS